MSKFSTISQLLELDATTQAKLQLAGTEDADPAQRAQQAQKSDKEVLADKVKEIDDLSKSDDPIDKQIFQLQTRINQLKAQKIQRDKAKAASTLTV